MGSFAGKLSHAVLADRRGVVRVTVKAQASNAPGPAVRIRLTGMLQPSRHRAWLVIAIAALHLRARLITARADPHAARRVARRAMRVIASNDLGALARMLAAPGSNATALERRLSAERVRVTRIRARANGRAVWLPDGDPGWLQPAAAAARGHATMDTELVLEQESGSWRLLGSGR